MDIITLAQAKKYAKALVETLDGEVDLLEDDVLIVDEDGDMATTLLLNAFRQHVWKNEEDALICEDGTKTLANTMKFPFNNSLESVALSKTQKNTKYVVIAEVASSTGNAGEVVISDKQVNGFKLAFTGGATSVTVNYIVIGGIL